MTQLLILLTTLAVVIYAQENPKNDNNIDLSVFGQPSDTDPISRLVLVPTPTQGSITALEKCGEGSQDGTHMCVAYHQCDGLTMTIVPSGSSNGSGLIDIRLGDEDEAHRCEHFLEVCCGVPDELREPVDGISVKPPVVTIPTRPSVTSAPTVATSPSPPVSPTTRRPSSLFCGIRNSNGLDFKITGNSMNEAEYGEFPWMVALIYKGNQSYFCGGSLIAPNVVLTGAHCVNDFLPNQITVRAGEWDTQTTNERYPFQERDVVQVIIHESYAPQVLYNDVALLILSSPLDQAENIGSICLPSQGEVITSKNCFASGWGKNVFGQEGRYQVILKKIELPMVQHGPCQRALRGTRLGPLFKLHDSVICAGGGRGIDTCTGDGGSPLVCPDPKNPSRYVQSGIVAWGIGCGEENVPGVYANVAKFRNWIDDQLSRLNINTDSYNV